MKRSFVSVIGLLLFTTTVLFGQNAHFTVSGIIEYEKSVNMYGLLKKRINKENEAIYQPLYDQYIKSQPQFKKLKSTLNFAKNRTLFFPIEDESAPGNFYNNIPMVSQNNVVFTDLQSGTTISEKKVFEETFLVKDSTRKISWKITNEIREIAGFTCRRANAIIMDSIYVVAFYTDKILVSGGPESFNGLPGMILGIALPHENITWFATKVTDITLDDASLLPPKKGKPVNNLSLSKTLNEATKNWGTWKLAYLKAFSL